MKNKKLRSASTQLHGGSTEPNKNVKNLLQQHLFYTNKDLKNYTLINVGLSVPIVTWRLTKNCSHIINDRPVLVIHRIMKAIRDPNAMMNHQVHQ